MSRTTDTELNATPIAQHRRAQRTRHRLVSFGTAAVVGTVVSVFAPQWLHGATRLVASYDAGALTLLGMLLKGLCGDPDRTRDRAALEDPGRNIILLVVLASAVLGLISAIAIIGHGPKVSTPTEKWTAYFLGILAIVTGWFLVHTVYTFRYAHLYWYDVDGDGLHGRGIKFPGTDKPSDIDFAYFSFTLGTSFAVSDPQVTETRVRAEIIGHSLISFAYNSVIIGMVINLFAGVFSNSSGP